MPPEKTPAASGDSTILNQPPAAPKTPEGKVYTDPTPAAAAAPDPVTPPATPPSGTPPATPPATPPTSGEPPATPPAQPPAATPQDPPKPGEPKTPPAAGSTPPADYDLKLPEGSPLTPEDLAQTLKDAKDAGMTKEQAEQMLEKKDQTARAVLQRQDTALKTEQAKWQDQCAKDPEIGGDDYAKNIELAKRAWDKLASAELKELASNKVVNGVQMTGLANHPEVVRLMVRIGKLIGEDVLVRGTSGAAPKGKNPEDVLYGNPKSPSEPMA
jgi:hypothetical protein